MIYIDTLTNAQFAAGLVGVVFGAPALYSTFYWLAKAIVDFFWPVEDPYTIEMRRLDAKFAEQYKADMTDEQAREMNAERWIVHYLYEQGNYEWLMLVGLECAIFGRAFDLSRAKGLKEIL